ncbi:MAG: rod shape-determining protein RodA [Burkholderiaceae bacterium]|nr:rod shape-determining protein RodA [Burkholderiaceae bacterium]
MILNERTPVWHYLRRAFAVFDPPIMIGLALLIALSLVTMHSAAIDYPGRFDAHLRNLLLALGVMALAAHVPIGIWMRVAAPLYLTGLVLLVAVALFGDISKGARRWLDIGVTRIQPSEILKIATPLMIAWYFQRREGARYWYDFVIAAMLVVVPVLLIARQPDLGTAILVAASGLFVIFLAGLPWRVIGLACIGMVAGLPLLWTVMKEYQRQRVLTLLDPESDPLGKGFHIIQSKIAVGSGGTWGKGWMDGTQAHLEFIPERTTDFIFAVYAEEFGFMGAMVLLAIYLLLVGRGLLISAQAPNAFSRLLAGALALILFTYAFVNLGMVSGILPVVGVPLPFMSYGGTAMVTLGLGLGLLLNIASKRRPVSP